MGNSLEPRKRLGEKETQKENFERIEGELREDLWEFQRNECSVLRE